MSGRIFLILAASWFLGQATAPAAPPAAAPSTVPPGAPIVTPSASRQAPVSPYAWFDPIIDLRALLVSGFVDEPDTAAMQRAVLDAMARSLRDPYTVYVPPDAEGLLRRQITGSYAGIGVELDLAERHPVVMSALDDSPALMAGVLPGDVLLEVDGRSTEGVDPIVLDQWLPGKPGTAVRLLVRRPDGTEDTLDITRRQIETQSVKGLARDGEGWRHMLDPQRRIGYLRVTQFNERTAAQLDAALARLRGEGMAALVLDLRGNGGGSLDAAVHVADRFLSSGGIVSLKGRTDRARTWDATADAEDIDVPMVVLVNQGSASASEVVAGALQDNRRAKVIGTRSYGKGSVQEVRTLPEGAGMVKLTTARYYLPGGRSVGRMPGEPRWGVEPESGFHVPMTSAQLLANVKARRAWEHPDPGSASSPVPQHWDDPEWIRNHASDPQLAAALVAMRGYLDTGTWPVVGTLSGEVGVINDELRVQLDRRRRLMADLERTEQVIRKLRGQGAGVDDPLLHADDEAQRILRELEGVPPLPKRPHPKSPLPKNPQPGNPPPDK